MKKFMGSALATAALFCGASSASATSMLTVTSVGVVYSGAPTADLYLKKSINSSSYNKLANDVRATPQVLTGKLDGTAVQLFSYCVDIFQYSGPGTFSVVSLQDYLNNDSKVDQIASLIDAEGGSLANKLGKVHDAEVQLAIWEVINETSSKVDLASGRFKVGDVKGTSTTAAQSMLNKAKANGGKVDSDLHIYVAKSSTKQDMLFWFRTPTAAVPEPASWAMMVLGLGAVGGALRASRRRATLRLA